MTLGVVALAVLIQLAALGQYGRHATQLKTLVATYQQEAAAEKQVIADLLRELTEELD